MLLTISVFIFITTALAFLVLAPRMLAGRLVFDATPDAPVPFGYQMAWLAVQTIETDKVTDVLGLSGVEESNWSNGIGTVYHSEYGNGRIFVSAPFDGWTFVVGLSLPQPLGAAFADKSTKVLLDLGAEFPEVQYFLCDAITENYAWARVEGGKLRRAFAFGDYGVAWNKGRVTPEEQELGLGILSMPRQRRRGHLHVVEEHEQPNALHVIYLAGRWSTDPTKLAADGAQTGTGRIGFSPAQWAPERLRRTG